jgi:hypothetical protein
MSELLKTKYHRTLKVEFGQFNGKTRFVLVTAEVMEDDKLCFTFTIAGNKVRLFCDDTMEAYNLFSGFNEVWRIIEPEMQQVITSTQTNT